MNDKKQTVIFIHLISGSSKKNREPKKKGPGKGRSKGRQKVPLVLVDRMPSPLPMPVVVPGPRDDGDEAAVPEAVNATNCGSVGGDSNDAIVDAAETTTTTTMTTNSSTARFKDITSSPIVLSHEEPTDGRTETSNSRAKFNSRPSEEEKHRISSSKETTSGTHQLLKSVAESDEFKSSKQLFKSSGSPSTKSSTASPNWINSTKSRLLPPSASSSTSTSSSSPAIPVQTSQSLPDLSAPARLDSSPGAASTNYQPHRRRDSPLPEPSSPSGALSQPSSPHRSPLVGDSPTRPLTLTTTTTPLPTPQTRPPRSPPPSSMWNVSKSSKSSPLPSSIASAFEIITTAQSTSSFSSSPRPYDKLRSPMRSHASTSSPLRQTDDSQRLPSTIAQFESDLGTGAVSAKTPPVTTVSVSPPPLQPFSKSKNTFLPVKNDVSKNNMSVAMTLARMSGGGGGGIKILSSHSPPPKSRPLPTSSSPEKRPTLVSPANLINSVRRKEVEAAKSRLNSNLENICDNNGRLTSTTASSSSSSSPGKSNQTMSGISQRSSFAPLIEEPFSSNQAPPSSTFDPHQFTPLRSSAAMTSLTSGEDDSNPGFTILPSDALSHQTLQQHQSLLQQQQQQQQHRQTTPNYIDTGAGPSHIRVPSTSSSEDVTEFLDPNLVASNHQRNQLLSPPSASSSTNPVASGVKKIRGSYPGMLGEKVLLCKDRTYDPDRHCGVPDEGNKLLPCTHSLTCKSHNLSARRAVAGRSKSFNTLLAEHKAAKEAKLRELGKLKKSPVPSTSLASPNAAAAASLPSSASQSPASQHPPSSPMSASSTPSLEPAFDQVLPTSLAQFPTAVMHYPGGGGAVGGGHFYVPPFTPTSSLMLSSTPPFSKPSSTRVSVVRTPFAPVPRSFVEAAAIPSGSPNRNRVATVPRPSYLPFSEAAAASGPSSSSKGTAAASEGEHVRGLWVQRGPWPTSAHPPQAVAMCSFGARATPSALPTSCSSGSCMLLGRRMDLFRSAFKSAVETHLNPPPLKKTCATATTVGDLSAGNDQTEVESSGRLADASFGFNNQFSTHPNVTNNIAPSNCGNASVLLQQPTNFRQQQTSAVGGGGGKADVNANLNGSLGVRLSGGIADAAESSSSNSLVQQHLLQQQRNVVSQEGQTHTLMSPPSRQPFSSSSHMRSSPKSAMKRKRSSSSFANRSDDSDSSCSSLSTTGTVFQGGGGVERTLPSSSSPQQFAGRSDQNNDLQPLQKQQQQQQQGNTQAAAMQQRQIDGTVQANSFSISLPLSVQSQVLNSGSLTASTPAFRQLTDLQQHQQPSRQMISTSASGLGLEQVIMPNTSGQFQANQLHGHARYA